MCLGCFRNKVIAELETRRKQVSRGQIGALVANFRNDGAFVEKFSCRSFRAPSESALVTK